MTGQATKKTGLIGDIGGTYARFAIADANGYDHEKKFQRAPYNTLSEAIEAYLGQLSGVDRPEYASISIAGPVTGDEIKMSNGKPWAFSQMEESKRLRMKLSLMNDFKAVALAVPHFRPEQLHQIGGGKPVELAPKVIIGPGTGLGMAGLIWDGKNYLPVPGEGGHATIPAKTQDDFAIFQALAQKHGHVSVERVCSGPGLVDIYDVIRSADFQGRTQHSAPPRTPEEICHAAVADECSVAREAVGKMLSYLGNAAGNLALTFNAQGGVYMPSSILEGLGDLIERSDFRQEFKQKGRFEELLSDIPTYVIKHPFPAFVGLHADLKGRMPSPQG